MAAVKKSVWNLGYRIAGMIVFLFSFLHLAPPAWARGITAGARSSSSQPLKPEAGALMESFLRESRFASQEINALNRAEPLLLAQAGKKVTNENQPKQAMTKQDKTGAASTKQNQPVQAMKLKQTDQLKQDGQPNQAMKLKQADQPRQAMKLKQNGQPNQAMKLKQADQPQQAMKLKQNGQPNQAMKLKQADQPQQAMKLKQTNQPAQAMKLAQPNKSAQPQQAMKLKQGQQNTIKQ